MPWEKGPPRKCQAKGANTSADQKAIRRKPNRKAFLGRGSHRSLRFRLASFLVGDFEGNPEHSIHAVVKSSERRAIDVVLHVPRIEIVEHIENLQPGSHFVFIEHRKGASYAQIELRE